MIPVRSERRVPAVVALLALLLALVALPVWSSAVDRSARPTEGVVSVAAGRAPTPTDAVSTPPAVVTALRASRVDPAVPQLLALVLVGLMVAGTSAARLCVQGPSAPPSRSRRWRARLTGAPPLGVVPAA